MPLHPGPFAATEKRVNAEIEIAIVGSGPAGCTLAALLAQRGIRTVVFDDDKRPELLVGESLLPRVVSLMRRLGIEDRVKEFSQHKPGVGFIAREGSRLDFFFPQKAIKGMPNYAYNIPRPEYDNLLRARAEELGVVFVKRRAELEKGGEGREIQLTEGCLASVPELKGRHPKLLVDSTGRARAFAKVIGIKATRGKRNDVAYFAHFEDFDAGAMREGQVVVTTLGRGWSWRIPLPGRLSVGVVVDKSAAKEHGETPEERLESIIDNEPLLAPAGRGRRRVTPVMTYTNYQLISDRGHGPGWVAAGDAFGFVDPMLSPGLFMAMHSADLIDHHVFSGGTTAMLDQPARLARAFDRVFDELLDWHEAWSELIEYFYDGRMYALHAAGEQLSQKYGESALPRLMERHLTKQITRLLSGVSTRSRYGRRLLRFSLKHLVWDVDPADNFAIRA